MATDAALRDDLRLALDPVLLAQRVGFTPDPWQATLLRSTAQQTILLCSRQAGKTSSTALLALHHAVFQPSALVLCISASERQAGELLRTIKGFYAAYGGPAAVEESALRLCLANRSRIIALPASEATIRGFSNVSLLIEDESSRCPDPLYVAIRPMLSVSGGRLVLLSTPWGQRGHFHEEWVNGGPDWLRLKVTAYEVPRIPREWLEQERRAIGPRMFAQEYLCEFVSLEDQLFDYDLVNGALSPDVQPLFGRGEESWGTSSSSASTWVS